MINPACYNGAGLVQDHNVREELLIHIAKEATAVRDAGWRALKVVSDIDDTFLCSGGSFPSGMVTFPVKMLLTTRFWNESGQVVLEVQAYLRHWALS